MRINARELLNAVVEGGGDGSNIPPVAGVYAIINRENGRAYIGSSVNMRQRLIQHRSLLRRNKHSNKLLRDEWATYGDGAFVFGVLRLSKKTDKRYLWSIERELTKQILGPRCYNWGICGQSSHFAWHPAMRGVADYYRPN